VPYFGARALHPPVEAREDAGRHPPVVARRPLSVALPGLCETEQMVARVEPVCSARGCRRVGEWALRWNNPRLHAPERRKTWVACVEHREQLASFLAGRGFLRETVPSGDLPPGDTPPSPEPPGPVS
jgi:hypothetical protein